MTQIEFYLMEAEQAQAPRFAAKLVLDAFRQGRQVHIHHRDEAAANDFSELLWRFSESSFLAHGYDSSSAISLSHGDTLPDCHDHLIVLSNKIPPSFSRFERLAVVVSQAETAKHLAREQYRYFKKRGYPLTFTAVKHANF